MKERREFSFYFETGNKKTQFFSALVEGTTLLVLGLKFNVSVTNSALPVLLCHVYPFSMTEFTENGEN